MSQQFRVKIGGNFSFDKLPAEVKENIKVRLAGKDHILKMGKEGILPGIKIDGREVSKDNIHEFEKKNRLPELKKLKDAMKSKKAKPAEEPKPVVGIEVGKEIPFDDLLAVKGIGPKSVDTLKEHYSTEEELKSALEKDKVPLKDNIISLLKKVLFGEE